MKRWLLALIALLSWTLPVAAEETFARTQVLMGDVPVTLTIETRAARKSLAFEAMDRAFDEARRLDASLSEWREASQATRLNRYAGRALVPVDGEMTALLLKAAEISELTDGAFDITFPSKNKKATYRDVLVLPELGLAYLRPGVKIGVSGIAKGFIVDAMSRILKKAGFKKFLVNAGDLYASGRWTIGIRDPDEPGSEESLCRLTVADRAVSTSGQYERGTHIVDPKTRKPDLARKSATVVARTSVEADALAKGFFILERGESEKILKERPDLAAVLVENDGTVDAENLSPKDNFRCRPF
ncbi:MAG TPA: FAD:protein FMN transferase [bacterium]|nr:FAD:protein FMN transferase [bacterium]